MKAIELLEVLCPRYEENLVEEVVTDYWKVALVW